MSGLLWDDGEPLLRDDGEPLLRDDEGMLLEIRMVEEKRMVLRDASIEVDTLKERDEVQLTLGAEGVIPGRYIVSLLRVFKQFTHTLPSR